MDLSRSGETDGPEPWSDARIAGLIGELESRLSSGGAGEDVALLESSLAALQSLAKVVPSGVKADVSKDAEIVDRLLGRTFAVQYNPNCYRRWLVRLPGRGLVLDLKPYVGDDRTGDHLGFGDSLVAAGAVAIQVADEASEKRRRDGPRPRRRLKIVR